MSETVPPDPGGDLLKMVHALGYAMSEWLERWRPVLEQLAEVMERPEVRAAIEQRRACGWRSCHCLCVTAHPADQDICEGGNAVVMRCFMTQRLGPVDVPLCVPCAVAQGVADLARDAR